MLLFNQEQTYRRKKWNLPNKRKGNRFSPTSQPAQITQPSDNLIVSQ